MDDIKPLFSNKLKNGAKVALVSPGFKITKQELQFATERVKALGLNPVFTSSVLEQDGCYAGTVESRAQEINLAFSDPNIAAIIAIRGGSGAFHLLDYIDYDNIIKNPKIFVGYSDITSLLISIYNKTGLITFHGPMPFKPISSISANYLKKIIMGKSKLRLENIVVDNDDLTQTEYRITTINPGSATGKIIGGNLTTLVNLIGSDYLPKDSKKWQNVILFVEEIDEEIYKIDRMLSQLYKAKILPNISGFIFGLATNCNVGSMNSIGLEDTLYKYFKDTKIPVFSGSMVGHSDKTFTIPIGVKVEINANLGVIKMLEPAVK